jgi:L-cysteine:1D-myo-inositol 2-amino-2-deoxy-alpha-D-glucopyranoside ligase
MISWPGVAMPELSYKLKPLKLIDSKAGLIEVTPHRFFTMYVCGITPYDSTHLGHAATYLTYDLINRYLTLSHINVKYTQNITDIDDPLLERAARDGSNWVELAQSQINLYSKDMTQLRVQPPGDFIKVTDSIDLIVDFIEKLRVNGCTYELGGDLYFDVTSFLSELEISEENAVEIFAQRGGDPKRVGKRHPLDPLLWLANKNNEPGWESPFGYGRPGWHVECTAIALQYLDIGNLDFAIDLQGGGEDLIFPHHFMSSVLVKAATKRDFARSYVHTAMVGLDGEKMSKSKGNLVLVSNLINQGVDPMVIRWALLSEHYQNYREWSEIVLSKSTQEVAIVRQALSKSEVKPVKEVIRSLSDSLANNLDTPMALSSVLKWANESLDQSDKGSSANDAGELARTLDALLGLAL